MLIGYASTKLENVCKGGKAAVKHLPGNIKPALLVQRMSELVAFDSLGQIPFQQSPLHFHPLTASLAGQYAVTLKGRWRIVFEPDGDFERQKDGTPIEETVTRITITYIGDYH